MKVIKWHNKLNILNGKAELKFAKKCIKKYNIRKNVFFEKLINQRSNRIVNYNVDCFFGLCKNKKEINTVSYYAIRIILNEKNILTIITEYDLENNNEESVYGFIKKKTVVKIKLKKIKQNDRTK